MNKHIVNVSDLVVSDVPTDIITTYALGSCLGITAYDPQAQVGGMVHCQLPAAPRGVDVKNPAQFVDTGVMALLSACYDFGAQKNRLVIAVAGGADVMQDLQNFKIANRNHAIVRKILWKNGLLIAAEDIGGTRPRTMRLSLQEGEVALQSDGTQKILVAPKPPCFRVALAQ